MLAGCAFLCPSSSLFGILRVPTLQTSSPFCVQQCIDTAAQLRLLSHAQCSPGRKKMLNAKSSSRLVLEMCRPVTLELGGNSPVVVCGDADLQEAAEGASFAIYFNIGEKTRRRLAWRGRRVDYLIVRGGSGNGMQPLWVGSCSGPGLYPLLLQSHKSFGREAVPAALPWPPLQGSAAPPAPAPLCTKASTMSL